MKQLYHFIWSYVSRQWIVVSGSVEAENVPSGARRVEVRDVAASLSGKSRHILREVYVCCLPRLLMGVGLSLASLPALAQSPAATALPVGGVVSAGQATISQSGSQMQIVQGSDKAALNWQSFNIGASAGVTFQQPSSQSVALNRVAGAEPSQIFGSLNANGKLILINPNGVLFGQGSRVDAAGLIATTKALSDADFMNGNYHFAGGGSGVVRNDGTLVAAPDGAILLVADKVINTGTMQVRGGTTGMVSADELQVSGDWKTATVTGAAAMNLSDVTVENLGRIDVSGLQGGQISLKGGNGTTQSGGELLAAGEQGRGGSIHLSGMRVGLLRGSLADASGASGGGDVLVGGDWQGGGSMEHASATYMDADAVIRVNATGQGDGGKAVLWSDGYTNFRGQIQANGAGTGNGGQVETSGKDILDALGSVTARGVQAGKWLLDPSNITIVSGTSTVLDGTNTYNPTTQTGSISNTEINTALDNNTTVTIATTAAPNGTGVGHLVQNVNADIVKSTPGEATLRLIASLDLVLNGNITAADGKLNVWLTASGTLDNGSGAILVNKDITTNGGTLDFRSGVYTGGTNAQTFSTAGGAVTFNSDLLIVDGLTIDTTGPAGVNGAVTFNGKIDSGDRYNFVATLTTWSQAEVNARSGTAGGSGDNESYLATPLSELQNLVAAREANFVEAWLGGRRTGSNWIWVGGIKKDQIFFTSSTPTTNPAASLLYTNWQTGEPNNSGGVENLLQFVGLAGKWNDLPATSTFGYVVQTNRPASPLTVNAGTATVTFGGAVGSLKPLDNLVVNGPTVINGGQIRTEAGQTYNDPVTIGSGPTLLESTQSSLNLITPMTFNQAAASALTIKAAQDIVLNTPITATNGPVSVTMLADSTNTGTGSITLNNPITTRGGAIDLTASSGIILDNVALDTGTGGGSITLLNTTSGDITATTAGSTMNAGTGAISVTNSAATGGRISLQDLEGGKIDVINNAVGVTDAVTLNGPITATGEVSVSSRTGDILVDGDINQNGAFSVSITADNGNTGTGAIMVNNPITITGGGPILLTASSGITLNGVELNAMAGRIALTNNRSGNITAAPGANIKTNGNIDVTNGGAVATAGAGEILLQELTGANITILSNFLDAPLPAGTAITLNGAVTGNGPMSISSVRGHILVNGDISNTGQPVSITANSLNTNFGTITLNNPITTNGGAISLTASTGIDINGVPLDTGAGAGNITLLNNVSGNITALPGATMNAGNGNISVINNGSTGGVIDLRDLSGTGITVTNNVSGVTGNAVTLNGPLTAAGTVSVSSLTGDILVDGEITGAASPVSVTADSGNTGNGAIRLNNPVTTNGGPISLTASTGIDINGVPLDTGTGAGDITLLNNVSGNITALPGATMNAGNGNISVINNGSTGGVIDLRDLGGTGITVTNNVSGVTGNAVTLNGPLTAAGTVSVSSLTGDILVDGEITGAASPVAITANSGNTGNGAIRLNNPVTTTGGAISLTASTGININGVPMDTGAGAGNITLLNNVSGNITAMPGATMQAGNGNISVINNGSTGGVIELRDLGGTGITVTNNVSGVTGNAVTLNGPLTAAGTVSVSSLTGDILVDGEITGAASPVSVIADSGNTGNGAITLNKPITTNGGPISLTASSGIGINDAPLNTSGGPGAGTITLTNKSSGDITATANATMNAGLGDISVTNSGTTGGVIVLQDLSGGTILVANNVTGVNTGNAVTLNGPVSGSGAVTVSSQTGDILVDGEITGATSQVSITADSGNTGNGAITLNNPVTTSGGAISLTASTGITLNGGALFTGAGNITLLNKVSGNITAMPGATMQAGNGNISVINNGSTGGVIELRDLGGTGITVTNNVSGVTGNAVTLNGPLTAAGTVSVSSLTGDILVDGEITGAASPVAITANSSNTGNGAIRLNKKIQTTGGPVTLTANGDIIAATGATMNAGNGDISVTNNNAAGGVISLQDLSGAKIVVVNEATALVAGIPAITLNGLVSAGDTVLVTSQTGDIVIEKNISSAATANASAVIVAAGISAGATDSTGGNVRFNGSRVFVDPGSRAIIFSGSIAGTTGLDATFPGAGNYRYNVAYNDTSRIASATGTYVQYREQPTLNISVPDRVYNAENLDSLDWGNYIVINGWQPGDGPANNPLRGRLEFNGDPALEAHDAGNYTINSALLTDTLGYKLDFTNSPSFNITRKQINIVNMTVDPREYDGSTVAHITGGTLDGRLGNDDVTLDGTTGQFDDKNVGVDKRVLVTNARLNGLQSHNYVIGLGSGETTGTITPKAVTVSGVRPLDRMYDGTTNATFTGLTELSGNLLGDDVSIPASHITGHFADKNAGSNKKVVVDLSATLLSGRDRLNYKIIGVNTDVDSATITPAPLQVSGVSTSKIFDGTTDAHTEAIVIGLMPGDSVSDVRQYFNNAVPGKNKLLSVPGGFMIHDGNDGNNYIIESSLLVRGEIKGIPTPSGVGANGFAPDSTNLDLLLALTASENLRQKFEQADYFLYPGEEPKSSSTHAASVMEMP